MYVFISWSFDPRKQFLLPLTHDWDKSGVMIGGTWDGVRSIFIINSDCGGGGS